ncbi:glutamate transport system substrate-binding protein [Streptomyces sp. DpondAA-D4]|nr:glutamate transport system substrate-binding protein [Streptomyces sp. DpondAA-D4]
MKLRKSAAVAAIAVLALTATACGGKDGSAGDKPSGVKPGTSEAPELPKYTVATGVDLDSPAFKAAKKRGKLVIGAKADQPYLGFEDQSTKERSGFDIEIAKMIAADLGFSDKQIEWKTVDSGIRETAIAKGQVDYLVGTYTINDERKKQVGFAGPYYKAGADLLVRKDETAITGKDAVKGKKVCSIVGSTPSRRSRSPSTVPRSSSWPSTRTACSSSSRSRSTPSPRTTRSSRVTRPPTPASSRSSASRSPRSPTASV